jgi:nucleotide-binding universal stress UspA family protein
MTGVDMSRAADGREPGRSVVVVGVDPSAGAQEALRFALGEAQLRHATLRVVHAWQLAYIGVTDFGGGVPALGEDIQELRDAAEATLDATLREAIPDTRGVDVERRVVEGAPAAVLVEESRASDLLVVGSRGHGGFAQLLLGSVSQQCAHHAECPVVVVRSRTVS